MTQNLIIRLSLSLTPQLPTIPSVTQCLEVSTLCLEQRAKTFTFGHKGRKEGFSFVLQFMQNRAEQKHWVLFSLVTFQVLLQNYYYLIAFLGLLLTTSGPESRNVI